RRSARRHGQDLAGRARELRCGVRAQEPRPRRRRRGASRALGHRARAPRLAGRTRSAARPSPGPHGIGRHATPAPHRGRQALGGSGMYVDQLVFGVGPYLAGTIFILGSILRYERGQYTWRAMSSQMLHNTRTYRVGNLLFHIGILSLFLGHLIGLLTPQAIYHAVGITTSTKQILSMVVGGLFGTLTLAGV